uniref:Uncharacterized protein n=1 Tax=Glossina austeni TaxID=7395 RepID=A0A1A9VL20_GLOAU
MLTLREVEFALLCDKVFFIDVNGVLITRSYCQLLAFNSSYCYTRSPVYSLTRLRQTFQGLTTIRALEAEKVLDDEFHGYQNWNTSAWFLFLSSNRAFALWTDIISGLIFVPEYASSLVGFPSTETNVINVRPFLEDLSKSSGLAVFNLDKSICGGTLKCSGNSSGSSGSSSSYKFHKY